MRAAILIFLLLPTVHGVAQQSAIDSLLTVDSVIRHKFVPTGLRVGGDIISIAKSQFKDNYSGWEANADIDIHRYIVSADFGSWSRDEMLENTDYISAYSNEGNYWRVGIDANFLTRDPERNAFFLGFRYGKSTYSETMRVSAIDNIWGPFEIDYSTNDLRARWFELAGGMKVKIYKFIWFGYTGSLKFGLKRDSDSPIISYDVPGYGRTFRDTTWGFTYQILFKIPFRETTPILPPKKKK